MTRELYNSFNPDDPEVKLEVVISSSEFATYKMSIDYELNFPPEAGVIDASSTNVVSISDTVTLTALGFTDSDLPLEYSFRLYKSINDYNT